MIGRNIAFLLIALVFIPVAATNAEPDHIDLAKLESQVRLTGDEQARVSLGEKVRLSKAAEKSFKRGLDLHKNGKYKEAIAAYEETLQSKKLFEPMYNIGLCQEALGNYEKAEQTFTKLVTKNPRFEVGLKHLAYIAFKRGNMEQASAYHKQYLELGRP